MEVRILSYMGGKHTQRAHSYIVEVEAGNVTSKGEALKLIGKKIVWKATSGKIFVGKITRAHGSRGALIVRFERGLPGEALGTRAVVIT